MVSDTMSRIFVPPSYSAEKWRNRSVMMVPGLYVLNRIQRLKNDDCCRAVVA